MTSCGAAATTGSGGRPEPLLSVRGLEKRFGAVEALRGVDLDVFEGDVLAVCGDNGAGKSTLIKILSGAEQASGGRVVLRGREVAFRSPAEALRNGVATIYQELALAPRLSISANVFMGSELTRPFLAPFLRVLDKARMASEARGFLRRLAVDIADMSRPVERLSGGQRQAVAISRALRWNADVIIMDEPTAALGVKETAQVHDLIRRLHEEGHTVILISHNMRDVVALASRVVILKGGRKIADRAVEGLKAEELSGLILSEAAPA
ncbi:MAG: sugar ABC transporter ATP-binding protein [Hyphomicrobiaceae bacterium]|nr:MAG: sugar ABC transporter ATP-binding protein [Hyphomicrobiaceae bacterium]